MGEFMLQWNEYTVQDMFGGPEEGGWGYQKGTPTGQVHFGDISPECTQGVRWIRERHAPKSYPTTRPRYE